VDKLFLEIDSSRYIGLFDSTCYETTGEKLITDGEFLLKRSGLQLYFSDSHPLLNSIVHEPIRCKKRICPSIQNTYKSLRLNNLFYV